MLNSIPIQEYGTLENSAICCDLLGLEKYLKRNKLSNVLKITPSGIKANYHVGVIKYKNFQLQILPKLITEENADENLILKNLIYMLSYTKKLNIKTADNINLSKNKNPFLEILIKEYATSLFNALKRLTPKNYIREENNLNYLKGKIKFSENIKYNCSNQAKFYCEYDEFSENNILNQLFLYVSSSLYEISKNSENKRVLKLIIDYFSGIKLVYFDKFKCDKIRLTRNQQLFEKPFKLAKMFVENSNIDFSKNKFENISLIWDMNKLFEEFIYQVIRLNLPSQLKSITAQKKHKLLKNHDSPKRDTFVDILIETIDGNKIVLDTKYKKFTKIDDISNGDIYQVCTYCTLHNIGPKEEISQNKNIPPHAILLYPRYNSKNAPDILEYRLNSINKNLEYNIHFRTVNLLYQDLKSSLPNLIKELSEILSIQNPKQEIE